ncbi:CG-1 DNA-binding domain [Dillenia turbinata]|uniref:CG-1 DNA-binding domain n=1 Tax=Dillenia turbinata TaxID=194707 RepID=A0AAN8YV68_9MAGN
MAESRRYVFNQQVDLTDLEQILQEARHRWLRPSEICQILRNYQKFVLTPEPPVRPPAGSLLLFDRKALRYFRKDGHRWRKKKDGKTIKEAHEKLKAGSVDVLHCYYAHGEENENFQRRSYWMLDGQLEHIVLVHYREVKEGYNSSTSRLLSVEAGPHGGSPLANSSPCSVETNSSSHAALMSNTSNPNTVDWNGPSLSTEIDDGDLGDDLGNSSRAQRKFPTASHCTPVHLHQSTGFSKLLGNHLGSMIAASNIYPAVSTSLWPEFHTPMGSLPSLSEQKYYIQQSSGSHLIAHESTDALVHSESRQNTVPDSGNWLNSSVNIDPAVSTSMWPEIHTPMGSLPSLSEHIQQSSGSHLIAHESTDALVHSESSQNKVPGSGNWLNSSVNIEAASQRVQEDAFQVVYPSSRQDSNSQACLSSNTQVEKNSEVGLTIQESGELKKLDSFGRWMDKEIGVDCDDSLMASDSANYWNTLDNPSENKEVSSLSRHMQLDTDSLGPSLSQEQLFSILDFSPDWAYSGIETKVLITGKFLGDRKLTGSINWCCMFGETEIPAEVLTDDVIRCQAPFHAPGRVPFYVTCCNRLACSEVREFEYRGKPYTMAIKCAPEEEVSFQLRLAKMLHSVDRKWLDCSFEKCDKCKLKNDIYATKTETENDWTRIATCEGNKMDLKDVVIQIMLKDRLYEWLVCKIHEEGKGPHVLDDQGQGVIHLAAALGYQWAMAPIVAAGVNSNFRDAHGRAGLHWASYFGREETVVALVKLGAAPGAVEDPTPTFPGGRKAADLASSRGHKGIAGYLAEADLVNHLSSLTVTENVLNSVVATIAAEKAIESAAQHVVPSDGLSDEQISLRESLAAVKKSAHAAALIHAAFRAHSFRQRQESHDTKPEVSLDLVALGSVNRVQKVSNFTDYLHNAAIRIQQRYRGWKGRKDFLNIRRRIVQIQAHVRGHQVRKQYKKVVWSVGIVEKAILRWRRKGTGLRGFRSQEKGGNMALDTDKNDEYEFLRIGRKQKYAGVEKALARVQSMVRHPEGRDQYMRLVRKFQNFEVSGDNMTDASQGGGSSEELKVGQLPAFPTD